MKQGGGSSRSVIFDNRLREDDELPTSGNAKGI
jgi:hypothetical protein